MLLRTHASICTARKCCTVVSENNTTTCYTAMVFGQLAGRSEEASLYVGANWLNSSVSQSDGGERSIVRVVCNVDTDLLMLRLRAFPHGGVPRTQKLRPSPPPSTHAQNPALSKLLFLKLGVGHDIALRVPPTARKSALLLSAFSVQSTFFSSKNPVQT